jgi:hypothetical protein
MPMERVGLGVSVGLGVGGNTTSSRRFGRSVSIMEVVQELGNVY